VRAPSPGEQHQVTTVSEPPVAGSPTTGARGGWYGRAKGTLPERMAAAEVTTTLVTGSNPTFRCCSASRARPRR